MYQSLKVNKQTTFVLTTLLGGMENIRNISDEQVVLLLQVILSGLKSSNPEMSGLGCILLGYPLWPSALQQLIQLALSCGLFSTESDFFSYYLTSCLVTPMQPAAYPTNGTIYPNHKAASCTQFLTLIFPSCPLKIAQG